MIILGRRVPTNPSAERGGTTHGLQHISFGGAILRTVQYGRKVRDGKEPCDEDTGRGETVRYGTMFLSPNRIFPVGPSTTTRPFN
nr:hypothetical protein Q903MT_gene3009 [Picea sitchensis]